MISKDKEYTTKSGFPARVYATDGSGCFPIHGAFCQNGKWIATQWTEDGCYALNDDYTDYDLIEKPKTIKVSRIVYLDKSTDKIITLSGIPVCGEIPPSYKYLGVMNKEFEIPTNKEKDND